MAKKGNDINLFKAASKADKKIQTGVSKGFLGVIAIVVVIIAFGGYIGSIIMETQTLTQELASYTDKAQYSSGINALANRIEQDKAYLAQIQSDIDAANAIKHYALATDILYPGLTYNQFRLVMTKSYFDGIERLGCVPESGNIVATEGFGQGYAYTDGIKGYKVIRVNDQDIEVEDTIVYPKGYIMILIQGPDETIAQEYVSNIIARAPSVFAIEEGANRDAISATSFETGIIAKPTTSNPNYVMFVKCKLKSVFQILLEDEYINSYLVGMPQFNFTGKAISINLRTHTISLFTLAAYLDSIEIFTSIGYSGETIAIVDDHREYFGTLICVLSEEEALS